MIALIKLIISMKIASVTNTPLLPYLGSGKTVIQWTSGLRKRGHEVEVFTPKDFYRPLPAGRVNRLKTRIDALKLERRLLEGRYDLIEFYGADFGWLIAKLASNLNRPWLVAHTNGLELLAYKEEQAAASCWKKVVGWPMEILIRKCDNAAFAKADGFAAICDLDAEYMISKGIKTSDRVVVVEPGVDHEYLTVSWDQPKAHRLAYLGSWASRKDIPTLVAVASQLMTLDSLLHLDVIGSRQSPETVLQDFPSILHDRIDVHPHLTALQIAAILSLSKIFIFPSLYEGFGMATSEAMACGCAVVLTRTGFGGSLRDGEEAFVRPLRDVSGIAEAATLLLNNPELRDRMARKGRSRVIKLTWDNQVDSLESTYRRWCNL